MLANLAAAQDTGSTSATYLESNLYRPPIETDGHLWTEDAGVEPDGLTHLSLQSNYIFDPKTETSPDNDFDASHQALRTDLIGAAAIRGVQLGVDVPMYVIEEDDLANGRVGLGDLGLDLKGGLIEAGEDNPVNVGAGLNVQLPTTADNIDSSGIDAVAWEARVVADGEIADTVKLAGNVGTRGLPDEVVETDGFTNQFFFRTGAGVDVVEDAGVSVDVIGAFDYDRPVADLETPVAGFLGGYGTIAESLQIRGGVGSGLIPGVNGPQPRAMLGISWMPSESMDTDLDSIGANMDQCPGPAEDLDGYEDDAGGPAADNDRDNVADRVDACADGSEDMDAIGDADGCADEQNKVSVRIRDEQGMALGSAKVSIEKDGEVVETGTGQIDAQLDPGVYTLVAEGDGFEPVRTSFRVYPQDTVQISATMTKSGASLSPTEQGHQEQLSPTESDVGFEHDIGEPVDDQPMDEKSIDEDY
jgi:hypothetical protein